VLGEFLRKYKTIFDYYTKSERREHFSLTAITINKNGRHLKLNDSNARVTLPPSLLDNAHPCFGVSGAKGDEVGGRDGDGDGGKFRKQNF